VFNNGDVFKKLIPFIKDWKSQKIKLTQNGKKSKLYFATVDVKSAYDSIPIEKMFSVISGVFKQNDYVLMKFNVMSSKLGDPFIGYEKEACYLIEYPQFFDFANELSKKYPKSIFSDQVIYTFIQRDEVLNLIEKHLLSHVVKVTIAISQRKIGKNHSIY
jgi:hypothetical protein